MLGSSTLNKRWVLAYRYADLEQDRPRSRFTLDYNVNPRLMLGLEYNSAVGELAFRGTYVLMAETERQPQAHLGTSSDRIGTPEGYQQYSITFAKAIPETPLAPYFSITYSEFDEQLVFPFGTTVELSPSWGLTAMNDGRKTHALVTYRAEDFYVQAGWIWLERWSLTFGFGF
ncbi:MAG: hypothetical protein KatS3mg015_2284 [Fimbriimonadales bacterium]|nr:MAG: hypothetical protein KatS3mg015_2284 [Fimbriimonadales bacterium]